ncbi:MAG: DoxX family membrane protein, partial [Deltaproteobacteria bacterium]|nr:DoxX family membrane protein [Deltaproteobacteria bacterium]
MVCRLFLGAVFVHASLDKIHDPEAFAKAVYNYQILPDLLVNIVAIVLPWLELVVGIFLITGLLLPGSVFLAKALMLVFFGAILFNMARG